jgi:hypothetical protein
MGAAYMPKSGADQAAIAKAYESSGPIQALVSAGTLPADPADPRIAPTTERLAKELRDAHTEYQRWVNDNKPFRPDGPPPSPADVVQRGYAVVAAAQLHRRYKAAVVAENEAKAKAEQDARPPTPADVEHFNEDVVIELDADGKPRQVQARRYQGENDFLGNLLNPQRQQQP